MHSDDDDGQDGEQPGVENGQIAQEQGLQEPSAEMAQKDASFDAPVVDKIEYLRNVFLKYLELRYSKRTKESEHTTNEAYARTIEQVMMAELSFTFEQTKKIEKMIPQPPPKKKAV